MAELPEFISVLRWVRDTAYPTIQAWYNQISIWNDNVDANRTAIDAIETDLTAKSVQVSADAQVVATTLTEVQSLEASSSASALSATTSADTATTEAGKILALQATAQTLVPGSSATAVYNPSTGIMSIGVPTGLKGDRGDAFTVDAVGVFADRSLYDAQPDGYSFVATDLGELYFRIGATAGVWSVGVPFGKGDTGDAGESINLQVEPAGNVIQWQYPSEGVVWHDLISLDAIYTSQFVNITGDTLTGQLKGIAPVSASDLTRKDYVDNGLASKASLASPALTGSPTSPTPAIGDSSTKIATTAFVGNAGQLFTTSVAPTSTERYQYTKIATINLDEVGASLGVTIEMVTSRNTLFAFTTGGVLQIKATQYSAFGNDPLLKIEKLYSDYSTVALGPVQAVVVQNTPTTIIDVYTYIGNLDESCGGRITSQNKLGICDITGHSNQPFETVQPTFDFVADTIERFNLEQYDTTFSGSSTSPSMSANGAYLVKFAIGATSYFAPIYLNNGLSESIDVVNVGAINTGSIGMLRYNWNSDVCTVALFNSSLAYTGLATITWIGKARGR